MNAFFDYAKGFVFSVSSTVNYYQLGALIVLSFSVIILASVCIRTAVYGRPRFSAFIALLGLIVCAAASLLGVADFYGERNFFKTIYGPLWMFLITFGAITVLYAGFYYFAVLQATTKRLLKDEATALMSRPIAKIDETPLYYEGEPNPVRLATEKLGSAKPRLDDKIDFFKVEAFIKDLYKKDLSPIDRATVEFCERTVRHVKNVELTPKLRRDVNDAFCDLIKIYARY